MTEVVSLIDFKKKKQEALPEEPYSDDEDGLFESLEVVLDSIEEHSDYGFVLLAKGDSFTSGATIADLPLLIHMLEETIIEMKEKEHQ